jgi:hypothetical protein
VVFSSPLTAQFDRFAMELLVSNHTDLYRLSYPPPGLEPFYSAACQQP